jgi:MYXO-CTERM domain-containing protein
MPNTHNRRPPALATALALAFLLALAVSGGPLRAATPPQQTSDGAIKLVSAGAESKFPEAIRFFAEVESQNALQDIRVNFSATSRGVSQYNYLEIPKDATGLVSGEFLHRLNTPDRYMPPGARMRYSFEITDKAGGTLTTPEKELVIVDARPKFKWESITAGPVTVMYSGPIETRAKTLADASWQTLKNMAPVTGAEIDTPITITLYANNADMIGAIQARSATISRELITEGQAFAQENVVMVLAGRRDIGTASHEITHILVGRAAGLGTAVPTWLNEGLAEFGNLDPTVSYDRFLDWGIDTDRITALHKLQSFPADPNLTIVSYGQARSIVGYMVRKYGPQKMAGLLATIGQGRPVESALQTVYGIGLRQLDAEWRESVGAEPYVEPTPAPTATPAQVARPTLAPYSLTPQAGQSVDAPTQAPAVETPSPVAGPSPAPEATPAAGKSAGGCRSSPGSVEASSAAALALLAGIVLVRTMRRRS